MRCALASADETNGGGGWATKSARASSEVKGSAGSGAGARGRLLSGAVQQQQRQHRGRLGGSEGREMEPTEAKPRGRLVGSITEGHASPSL